MDRNELRKINVTKYASVSTSDTKIGDDIPEDKVRHIWRVVAVSDDGSQQLVTLYAGDSGVAEREVIGKISTPASSAIPVLELGGDITNPIYTIRPQKTGSTDTYNRLYAKAQTSAVNITVDYYDE